MRQVDAPLARQPRSRWPRLSAVGAATTWVGPAVLARLRRAVGQLPRAAPRPRWRPGRHRRPRPLVAGAAPRSSCSAQVLPRPAWSRACSSPAPRCPVGDGLEPAGRPRSSDAVDSANRFAPPVPDEVPGVDPLLIVGGLGLPAARRRPGVHAAPGPAGRPAAAHHLQRAGEHARRRARHWFVFALTAVGFLAMLFVHEDEQISRWGRSLDRGPGRRRRRSRSGCAPGPCGPAPARSAVSPPRWRSWSRVLIPTLRPAGLRLRSRRRRQTTTSASTTRWSTCAAT